MNPSSPESVALHPAIGMRLKQATAWVCLAILSMAGARLSAQTTLTAAVGLALSPYVMKDGKSGLEVDIVRRALRLANYNLDVQMVPLARVPVALLEKSVDCALTINESLGVQGLYFSQSHVTYQNVAIALKSRCLKISTIKALMPFRVVAFQNAGLYLGKDFAELIKAKSGKSYSELADQTSQVKLLFVDHADVLVMDINIFKFFRQNIKDVDVSAEVEFFPIFPPTHYQVAFANQTVRDKFNEGLAKLKASGEYDSIIKSYIKEFASNK